MKSRLIKIFFLLLILAVFCLALFVFEYKGLDEKLKNRFPQLEFIADLPNILDIFFLPYQIIKSPLPSYNLIIDPTDLEKLEKSLSESPSDLLSGADKESIPVEFIANEQKYQAKMRIHGDMPTHWKDQKKSWQITFKDNNLFEGKKKISLILPEDRSFISEYLSNYRAEKLGLIVPSSRFVVLKINDRRPAVYFEIESWSKEFLEKNQLPNEANLYGENDNLAFNGYQHDLLEHPAYWRKYTQDSQSQLDNFAEIDLLGKLLYEASDEEFYQQIPNLIDMDNFYKWQAHSMLMGSTHQDFVHNVRLYFNISRGKFEFIPWDLRQFDRDEFTDLHYNKLVSRILGNPEFLHQRNKVLWDYVKDDQNLEDDLEFYDQTYQQVKTAFFKDRIKSFSNFYFIRKITNKRNLLVQQYRNIQNTLTNSQVLATVRVLPEIVKIDITTQGFSDIILDLEGKENFQMFTQREIPRGLILEEEIKLLPTTYTFSINKSGFDPDNFNLKISNAITGSEIEPVIRYVDEETFKYFEQINYSRDEFLKNNLIFRRGPLDNQIILYPGTYLISKTIIIPRNLSLEIKAGSRLYFAPDISLVSYSPVRAQGTGQNPILFIAQDRNRGWGVVAVVDSEESIFEHCYFEYGGQAYINGAFFSGQLAMHYTDAQVKNCQFKFAQGDDGLNIKKSRVDIEYNYFEKNKFDGLDLDWAEGRVANNHFLNNGNDGLDLGGTDNLMVWNNRVEKSGDKCLSIGERSKETIVANNLLDDCQIGVAVKDASEVKLINNTIVNNKIGISVYEKKPLFGGARPKAFNNLIWFNEQSISLDNKSDIEISYSNIEGGYQGENNLSQEPILDNQEILSLTKGGNLEAINAILRDKIEIAPIGVIASPPKFND